MNFRELLEKNNCEYHYYGGHNVLSIKYQEGNVEVSNAIKNLCEEHGYINGVRVTGRAVLEVSSNPDAIREMGFESEEYKL